MFIAVEFHILPIHILLSHCLSSRIKQFHKFSFRVAVRYSIHDLFKPVPYDVNVNVNIFSNSAKHKLCLVMFERQHISLFNRFNTPLRYLKLVICTRTEHGSNSLKI